MFPSEIPQGPWLSDESDTENSWSSYMKNKQINKNHSALLSNGYAYEVKPKNESTILIIDSHDCLEAFHKQNGLCD